MTTSTLKTSRLRELDARSGDGAEVSLLWDEAEQRLVVVVNDRRSGEQFEVNARPDNAMDVFHHPFAYRRPAG